MICQLDIYKIPALWHEQRHVPMLHLSSKGAREFCDKTWKIDPTSNFCVVSQKNNVSMKGKEALLLLCRQDDQPYGKL